MQRLIQAVCVAVIAIAWQVAASTGAVDPLILPPLSAIFAALGHVLLTGALWPAVGLTLLELVAAFGLATAAGLAAGYAVSRSAYAVRVFDPLLAGLYAVPTILLFPLYLLFFGIGPLSKIALGASIAFFPIVLSTISGFAQVNPVHVRAARSMGASNAQLFWSVFVPDAFPIVLSGLRMGLVLGFLTILGGETLASNAGLGHEIVTMAESLEPPSMFAYIFIAVALALGLNAGTSLVEARGRRGFE
jgi:ABC-type nitrate/sulfonate/bicarbonate transport system permease component